MTFEPRELCKKDRELLNEVRASFQEKYEHGVAMWNRRQHLRYSRQRELDSAYEQGNYEGLKFAADMLLHLLGEKEHKPITKL